MRTNENKEFVENQMSDCFEGLFERQDIKVAG